MNANTAHLANILSQNLAALERSAAARRMAGQYEMAERQEVEAKALVQRIAALMK